MKRSLVNHSITKAIAFARQMHISLAPFAFWTPDDWRDKGPQADPIRDLMLGWDVTDFGLGDFYRIGRTLFTLRNGSYRHPQYPRRYSEKFIFIEEDQPAPIHFHRKKTEDIICRAGGNVMIRLFKAAPDGSKSHEPFDLPVDGCWRRFTPGQTIRLTPGQSILVPDGIIHEFWSERGSGMTISGEVGSICDDVDDNIFLAPCERFVEIEPDEPPLFLLCNEYPTAPSGA